MNLQPSKSLGQDRFPHAWRGAVIGALLAMGANLLLWQAGLRLFSVPFMIRPGPPGTPLGALGAGDIMVFSVLPAFLAAALLRWLSLRSPTPGRTFITISEVVLVLSFVPHILMPVAWSTRLSLMLMNTVTALAITGSLFRWAKE